MSTNEETMLIFVNKLIDDATTPTEVLKMMFKQAVESDHAKVVQKIILSGFVDSYLTGRNAESILMGTFDHFKQYEIVKLLLLNNNDSRYMLHSGNLVYFLDWACFDGKIEVVKLLMDKTDVSSKDSYAFREAVKRGHIEIVKLLLTDKHVNPEANNNEAIIEAYKKGYIEIVKLLIPLVDIAKIDVPEIQKIKEEMEKSDDYEEAKILLGMLSEERAKDYILFHTIGIHLSNIDHRLLTEWIEFSKCSNKEKCENDWDRFKKRVPEKFAIGSLRLLASQDNPVKYVKYQYNKGINETVDKTKISQTDNIIIEIPFNTLIQKLRNEQGGIIYVSNLAQIL